MRKSLFLATILLVAGMVTARATDTPGTTYSKGSMTLLLQQIGFHPGLLSREVPLSRSPIVPIQFACNVPGQQTCINGWRWVCQCFSYGCNYMTTAYRC